MDVAGTEVLTLTNSVMTLKGTTPSLIIGDAGAEDTKIVFDGNAQDFYIGLDDSADDLIIGRGATVGTTPVISIDENSKSTFSGAVQVGVDDTGHDVTLYGATSGRYVHWDESNDSLDFKDSVYARFGTGNDLNIYHDASHSMINAASGTGALKLKSDDIRLENASANNVLKAVGDGYVTMPLQPAFQVRKTGYQSNIGTSHETITWDDEVFDVNSDFASNTFTAPVTGKYQLNITLRLQNIDTDHDYIQFKLVTSNREYEMHIVDCGVFDQDSAYQTFNGSVLVDMDASDTAYLQIRAVGGTAQTDISYGGDSHWTGYLAC
jgi:hypothetical protein